MEPRVERPRLRTQSDETGSRSPAAMPGYVIGLDLGASSLKAGLFDSHGSCIHDAVYRTPSSAGPEAVIETLASAVHDLSALHPHAIGAVGVGTPGLVDCSGVVHGPAVNIDRWQGTSLATRLAERTGLICVAGNDVSWAALGEARTRGCSELLLVALGTGVGGGIVSGGRLVTGMRGMAGEIGHISVVPDGPRCGCGQHGCLELYAGAPYLLELYRGGGTGSVRNIAELADRFANGDPTAATVVSAAAQKIARAVGFCLSLLSPEVVVIGGGISEAIPAIVALVADALGNESFRYIRERVTVEACRLGPAAGMTGAAFAAAEAIGSAGATGTYA